MKYYIIAGEASGDLHGAALIKAIKDLDPAADIRFWGGDLMENAGGVMVKHYRELAFMGFIEVVLNLKTILRNIKICKADIEQYNPDALIFIDYPGFNMRIAKWAKKRNYRTHYYISPQIWAWKENRIKDIRRDVDRMYVILPFEKDFYENKHKYDVNFVGHPLVDAVRSHPKVDEEKFREEHQLGDQPVIALLPGSRKQEINKMLNVMLSIVGDFPEHKFVIAGAPGQDDLFYEQFLNNKQVGFISNKTYDLLSVSAAAIVTSGTATLETALFKVPEVVCYKGSWASYQIAKRIITLKYISLVNLIMDKQIVTELIQDECNTENLRNEVKKLLEPTHRRGLLIEYDALQKHLGGGGAAQKTARAIIDDLHK